MIDLVETFASLDRPIAGGADTKFTVVAITDDLRHLVGKDQAGFPAILVDAAGNDDTALLRVELEHLTVQPDMRCEVLFKDSKRRIGSYTLIRCTGDDEMQTLFLRLVGSLLKQLEATGERSQLAKILLKLVDLFRALTAPPRRSVQGLWSELFLIAQALDPIRLLEAWHNVPGDLYDFNDGMQRIEVKSSSQRDRLHGFALEQLYPPEGTVGVVASIIAEQAGAGASVEDLVDQITERCVDRPELQLKLRTIVTETLGADWRQGARARFDWNAAAANYRIYRCEDVPKIDKDEIPSGVSQVRFQAALDDVRPMRVNEIEQLAGLVLAALPRAEH